MTGYIPRRFTRPQAVTHLSTNLAVHGRKSNSRPVDHKSDAPTTTLPSHPGFFLGTATDKRRTLYFTIFNFQSDESHMIELSGPGLRTLSARTRLHYYGRVIANPAARAAVCCIIFSGGPFSIIKSRDRRGVSTARGLRRPRYESRARDAVPLISGVINCSKTVDSF